MWNKKKSVFISRGTTATRHCPVKNIAQSMVVEVLIYLLSVFGLYAYKALMPLRSCVVVVCCSVIPHTYSHSHSIVLIIIIIISALLLFFLLILYILFFIIMRARTITTEKKKKTAREEQENKKQCVRWTKSHVCIELKTTTGTEWEKKCHKQTDEKRRRVFVCMEDSVVAWFTFAFAAIAHSLNFFSPQIFYIREASHTKKEMYTQFGHDK